MPLPILGALASGLGRSLLGGAVRGGLSGSMMMRGPAGGSGGGGLLQNLMASGGGGESPESQGLTGTAKRDFFALGKEMTNKFEGNDKQRQDQREASTKGPKPMMKILGQMAGKAKGIAGLNISMAAFARSSSLFQSSMGAFNQVMGAYADMFFAPFAPYVFKFIGFLSGGIEGFGKIWAWIVKVIGVIWSLITGPLKLVLYPAKLAFKYIADNWDTIYKVLSTPFTMLGDWLRSTTWWRPFTRFIESPAEFIHDWLAGVDWSGLWKGFLESSFVLTIARGMGHFLNVVGKWFGKEGLGEGLLAFVGEVTAAKEEIKKFKQNLIDMVVPIDDASQAFSKVPWVEPGKSPILTGDIASQQAAVERYLKPKEEEAKIKDLYAAAYLQIGINNVNNDKTTAEYAAIYGEKRGAAQQSFYAKNLSAIEEGMSFMVGGI